MTKRKPKVDDEPQTSPVPAGGAGIPAKEAMRLFREKQRRLGEVTPKSTELIEIEQAINDVRLCTMLNAAISDHLDPSSLRGDLRLPGQVVEKISKPDGEFDEDDLKSCLVLLSKDNLAELLALIKSNDEKIRIEAWRIIRDIVYGKGGSGAASSGGGGGSPHVTIQLVAPDGTKATLDEEE